MQKLWLDESETPGTPLTRKLFKDNRVVTPLEAKRALDMATMGFSRDETQVKPPSAREAEADIKWASQDDWDLQKKGYEWVFVLIDNNKDGSVTEEEYEAFQKLKKTHDNWERALRETGMKQYQALLDHKVQFLTGTFPAELLVTQNGVPGGLTIVNRSGRQAIRAKVIIDATPDAVLTRQSSAEFEPFHPGPKQHWFNVLGGELKSDGISGRQVPARYRVNAQGGDALNSKFKEVLVAALLFECGDHNGQGRDVLEAYTKDVNGHFAAYAHLVLTRGTAMRSQ